MQPKKRTTYAQLFNLLEAREQQIVIPVEEFLFQLEKVTNSTLADLIKSSRG